MSMRLLKYTMFFAAVIGVEGCAVGPHYKAPQPAAATYHAADPQLVTDAPFDARWWKQFDDPVLDSLIEKSLVANTSIRIAEARLAESRAVYDERNSIATLPFQSMRVIAMQNNRFRVFMIVPSRSIHFARASTLIGRSIYLDGFVMQLRRRVATAKHPRQTCTMSK